MAFVLPDLSLVCVVHVQLGVCQVVDYFEGMYRGWNPLREVGRGLEMMRSWRRVLSPNLSVNASLEV